MFVNANAVNIPYTKNGDILITSANGSNRLVGKHTVVRGIEVDSTVHGGFMLIASSDEPEFVNASMSSAWYTNFIKVFVAGGNGAIGNLNKKDLDEQDVLVPYREERDRIGSFFSNIDNLITLHERKWNYVICHDFNYTWEQRKLGDVAEVNPKSVLPEEFEYVDLESVVGTEIIAHRTESKESAPSRAQRLAKAGDVFYQTVRPYQKNNCLFEGAEESYVFSTGYAQLRPHGDSYLLLTMLQRDDFVNNVMERCTGTSYPAINANVLADLTVSYPADVQEQAKIGQHFKNLDNLITLHEWEFSATKKYELGDVFVMEFASEKEFEDALIVALQRHGWGDEVLEYPTEQELLQNWADILLGNNRDINRLNNFPLTADEMKQILDQLKGKTPLELNQFINGKYIQIRRTNPDDKLHYGKDVSLKIYDPLEIAAGQTRYQIARQPKFARRDKILQDRRGDLLLLINGMPLFHIELKRSGVPVTEACNQIKKYYHEGIFSGILSLVQIFVAMNPRETLYFANPGTEDNFNPDFYFHWADFNNEPVNDWQKIASQLISIPEAHQLIGFYTIADTMDGILKVMRSYQQYATQKILNRVQGHDWEQPNQRGGHIWHTTGSGKTMTSFKSAQLIVDCGFADKVVFLLDRIELSTQSLRLYKAFAGDSIEVQDTEDTMTLITKLASDNPNDSLIVSSLQKMGTLREDSEILAKRSREIEKINALRLVFIVDECHRSTFGEMMNTAKEVFPHALFFGFTGTPVFEENEKVNSTTTDIFGDELHRYTIVDGIRDKNVLGFDPVMVKVYKDKDLRQQVALLEAKANSVEEAVADAKKSKVYYKFMNPQEVSMAGTMGEDGNYHKGIEDYIPKAQYEEDKYQYKVVEHMLEDWLTTSRNGKFHGIFATSSIPEAMRYYRKFKERAPHLHIAGLFDPTIDNKGKSIEKEDGLKEMLEDYNEMFGMNFDIASYANYKKDVASRLAHKVPYKHINEENRLDLLIVVNQMLTGFDSKWVNRLYLDKVLVYQNLIQAISRTNRLFNINEKPFGQIYYYRMPHTMHRNIEDAVKLYSGDRPRGLFVDHLADNILHMNDRYREMKELFVKAGIPDMDRLPEDNAAKGKFAKLFREFSNYYQAAQIQGFNWKQTEYEDVDPLDDRVNNVIHVEVSREQYEILAQRYKELRKPTDGEGEPEEVTFDIDPYLSEQETGIIDYNYMNSRFVKWMKQLHDPNVPDEVQEQTLSELHKSFAFLSQADQKLANLFLGDVKSGDAEIREGWTLQDYIAHYAVNTQKSQVEKIVSYLGCDEKMLLGFLETEVTEANIDNYGRFSALKDSIVTEQAGRYFASAIGREVKLKEINRLADVMLRKFVLSGGQEIVEPKK